MQIFTPAQHKRLEASLYWGDVMVPGVATAVAQGSLRWGRCCLAVMALVASAQTGRAQDVPGIACIMKANTGNADIGRVSALHGLPGDWVLLGADNGLFLARVMNGAVTVDRKANTDTGRVLGMRDFQGGGVLIQAQEGSFLARVVNGVVSIDPAGDADTGRVFSMRDLPGGGVLIGAVIPFP
jgi:hypothetical protein